MSGGGSFESLIYDPNTYATDLKQSTAPVLWTLDPNYANHCNPTFGCDIGYNSRNGVSIAKDKPLIDVDSDLKLLNFRNSLNPSDKYIPPSHCTTNNYHFPCSNLGTEYTSISHPKCLFRGSPLINRFQPLCLNPQDELRWLQPSEIGINYRMVVKDNHVPCIPCPLPQDLVSPKPTNRPVIDCRDPCEYLCAKYNGFGSPFYSSYYEKEAKC